MAVVSGVGGVMTILTWRKPPRSSLFSPTYAPRARWRAAKHLFAQTLLLLRGRSAFKPRVCEHNTTASLDIYVRYMELCLGGVILAAPLPNVGD